jgi:hypothetical protein
MKYGRELSLEPDEVLTLKTKSGTEVDVARKSWGYYGSPSLNARLREHGLRAVLAMGRPREGQTARRMYLLYVEDGHEAGFEAYLAAEAMEIVAWLDSDDAVAAAAAQLQR